MGRVRTMRQEDIDWMLANYGNKSVEECAAELNVSVRTIPRWAASLGLPKKRDIVKPIKDNQLKRKDCLVKKCCLICEHWKDCDVAHKIDGFNACKLVCFDFELNKELMIE